MAADFDDAFASDEDVKPVEKIEPAPVKKEVPVTPKGQASKNKKKSKKGKAKTADPLPVPEPTIAPEEAA